MDLAAPVILFGLGFVGAVAIRSLVSWVKARTGRSRLPVEGGAVRLEEVGRRRKGSGGARRERD